MITQRPQVTGVAHLPTPGYLIFNTAHYPRYDPNNPQHPGALPTPFTYFAQYDGAVLFNERAITSINDIPRRGVRLSDLAVSWALASTFTNKELHEYWPAEFDQQGMVRATRVPLGRAAKRLVQVGDRDIDGNVVQPGQQGWYPKWWIGLHCLCGARGLNVGGYLQRPSHEQPRCDGFSFKITQEALWERGHNS